ncbi:putative late blight resistance protein-like protein R1A-3 [Forsythia ovata]|uniref:Late blight resistance protein-like protein R1A-3 n=1 Tax=Forsythia ovata TaxID=205694 RepID=A0ABD1QW28_9LAMI
MAPQIYHLTKALKSKSFIPGMPDCDGDIIVTVCHYIIKLCSSRQDQQDGKVISLLKQLNFEVKNGSTDLDEDQSFMMLLRSFVRELKVFFEVPNSKSTTLNQIELLSAFIDFLLEIYDGIWYLPSTHKDSLEFCQTELKFFITFLGDKPASQPTSLDENKNVLTDIEAVANDIGSLFYLSYFYIGEKDWEQDNRQGLAIADILGKVEQVKVNIKEQCMAASWKKLTPKTIVDQIRTIHEELTSLRSFLEQHPELEGFLIETSDIAYEVLYILTSYAPVWYLTLRLPQVVEKIKLIRLPLEKLNKYPTEQVASQDELPPEDVANRMARMLKDAENPSPNVSLEAQTPSVKEDIFVGLDDEANEITEILLGNQKEQQIISIWGMPGLGKTTLANKIYNSDRIVQHFHKRASCVISQTYDKKNALIAILTSMSSLERDELSKLDEDTLGGKIYQSLYGKGIRYLIILDDIWKDVWSDLHRYFPENQSGSRILFTTRFKEIGSQASDKSIVRNLRFLTADECWILLKIKVFHNEPYPLELEDIGMKIARKCGGLPLAVVVIAAVLANMKKNKAKWEEVAESLRSHISKDNSCMKILELSYNYLPMHLKPCFLYFVAFEEDREIPVQKLISLWVAEGFVQKVEQKNSNAVSYGYLIDLINRGLVQVGKRRSNGGVKTCYVHDLLHEMCLTIAEKDNFMKVIQDQFPIYVQHQRLSILSHSVSPLSRPFGAHVRSLLGYLHEPSRFIFSNMKLVKVLDLSAEWSRETKFEKLDLLRLKCKFSSEYNPSKPYYYPTLDFLKHLESLSILFRAHGVLSNVITLPLTLRNLTLTAFKLNSNEMKMIGELPKLEVLKLESSGIEDYKWNPNEDEFQQLRFLKLDFMGVQLNVSSYHFSRLEQLVLTRFMTAIPSSLGDIPTLVKIEVRWCEKQVEESASKIQEEQKEYGNELLKVIIISSGR